MLEDLKIASFREYNLEVLDAIEAQFMLKIARVIMSCALIREESRGAHTRLDFPERDDGNWLGNIVLRREGDRVTWRFMAKEE
jgi:succinate dehydrogenase/fumarate reductase flavoprotein subunit